MQTIFRENASKKEKAYTLFLYFWIALILYGAWTNFDSRIRFDGSMFFLSLLCGCVLIYPLYAANRQRIKMDDWEAFKTKVSILFMVLFSCVSVWFNFSESIPAIYTECFGKPYLEIVQVEEKSNGPRRGCGPRIKTSNGEYCVQNDFFSKVRVNDSVVLYGKSSGLGFKITHFSLK
ncbi:hypothetical protein [Crenobacter caeni]|uniref:Uncharacterized protein n=1 Tax=Crenobacter caeni TaxID=2705474 RepID=A0A6B2KVP4_9NEIS|nr:hypothetical protein [Crenobacter caeni]NDV14100.1 hypothetical protein [Crenobacter caeni]